MEGPWSRIDGCMEGWIDVRMDGWMHGPWSRIDGCMEGWIDVRMDGWMDGGSMV